MKSPITAVELTTSLNIIPREGHGPGEAGAAVIAHDVLELSVHRLDVNPEAGGLRARVSALLAHLVLDLQVDALLVRLQLRLGRERLPAVIAYVVPESGLSIHKPYCINST